MTRRRYKRRIGVARVAGGSHRVLRRLASRRPNAGTSSALGRACAVALAVFIATPCTAPAMEPATEGGAVRKIDGYRGIWFDLGQRSQYGSKYSGGLGTYTAKHRPVAAYSPQARKTFFVYGGTTRAEERHLLAMVAYYDHARARVPRPTVVHDKQGVDDPHDNPSLSLDGDGYLWVFVSGRARARPGYIYRSKRPLDIEGFDLVRRDEFTYPQPWAIRGRGFLHLFTRYTKGRELYWTTSSDGHAWSTPRKLAGMGGHYQVSACHGTRVVTAFNMHPGGVVDRRTNLYFLQTDDLGRTWRAVTGELLGTPLVDRGSRALVRDYAGDGRLVYLKDLRFDSAGRPIVLYITTDRHTPGPHRRPRRWTVAHWSGHSWDVREITDATHNYDMGSLYVEDGGWWRIIAPTGTGPQPYGTGGEVVLWESRDAGRTWDLTKPLTRWSPRNHSYVRRAERVHDDFYAFWADGDPEGMSPSRLYFTRFAADGVWVLPDVMDEDFATPRLVFRRRGF